MKDVYLEATITTVTIRGEKADVAIMGISFSTDAPALGSRVELRIGNQPVPAHVIDMLPILDSDLATEPVSVVNYQDLGGVHVNENELLDIRLYDPGAAELMSGVIWVEDFEPAMRIPEGKIITLKIGGTNDGGTSIAVTGADMDGRKLQDKAVYTPFKAVVRAEDKVVQYFSLRVGKEAMALPPHGTMIYPNAPLQFTGQQWNAGQVIGKLQVQAATKVECILYCTESFPTGPGPSELQVPTSNMKVPGVVTLAEITGKTASSGRMPTMTSGRRRFI